MASRNDVRAEIRQFLTTRRAKLTPELAGLPTYGGNRRVPGLRREDEVERAHLIDLVRTANAAPPARRRVTPFSTPGPGSSTATGTASPATAAAASRSTIRWLATSPSTTTPLELPADPGQTIVAYTAEPGSPARQALDLLASWISTPDHDHPHRHLSKELPVPIQPKQPTAKGPAEWFTGDVFIDAIARGEQPSRVRVSAVRFTPAARTAWHAHAVGQTLYVTEGKGLVQARGGVIEEIRAGDVITTPPDEWHWHGAAPDHYMTHLSITEAPGDDRPEADWGEHVTDAQYAAER